VKIVDTVALVLLALFVIVLASVIARQRQMLRSAGGIPLGLRRGNRWLYGVGRYDGADLKWYWAIGIGTRPSLVLHRRDIAVLSQRPPTETELKSVPVTAVIVKLRAGSDELTLAMADGAYTGLVSWLEASAPADGPAAGPLAPLGPPVP